MNQSALTRIGTRIGNRNGIAAADLTSATDGAAAASALKPKAAFA